MSGQTELPPITDDDFRVEEWTPPEEDRAKNKDLSFYELLFHRPLNYRKPSLGSLRLSFKLITDRPLGATGEKLNLEILRDGLNKLVTVTDLVDGRKDQPNSRRPLLVYLCGGPGARNHASEMPRLSRFFVDRGYWILYPDYRGTGDSGGKMVDDDGMDWLRRHVYHLRQTDIVRDLESVRRFLLGRETPWITFGQSYGGWITLTYLSLHPEGLSKEVPSFITSGIPPFHVSPREHFTHIYEILKRCNDDYYKQHPDDVNRVKNIVLQLIGLEIDGNAPRLPLPDGSLTGRLTAKRFLSLGRTVFGKHENWNKLTRLVEKLHSELSVIRGDPQRPLSTDALDLWFELDGFRFWERPIFFLLYEAGFLNEGTKTSQWTCLELARSIFAKEYWWADAKLNECATRVGGSDRLYFSGEMMYPCWCEAYSHLETYRELADELHRYGWQEPLYDERRLKNNKVPIRALVVKDDPYVSYQLSLEAAGQIPNLTYADDFTVGGRLEHGMVRTIPEAVLGFLVGPNAKLIDPKATGKS